MQKKRQSIQLNFKLIDWKKILLVCILSFYLAVLGNGIRKDIKPAQYRGDYLAFWSIGKIASETGFSHIYDLNYLQNVQSQGLKSLGFIEGIDGPSNPTIPVPYFSFFVIPFLFLSKIPIVYGYWLWTLLNLVILIGYLTFFFQKLNSKSEFKTSGLFLLSTILLSYPVFINFLSAQVEVFLVVFIGEFIRAAVNKKIVLSGVWLGGLLLKPQLLILVIPVFLLLRYWKLIYGFLISSGIILLTSLLLSGLAGFQRLINLWTKYSSGMASNSTQAMINWRMVGINLNTYTGKSGGWIVVGLGMVITILAVFFLIKKNPAFGSPKWVMAMLGVFSATLSLTWHSHYHMAMVLIPCLIYVSSNQLLSQKVLFLWAVGAPVIVFGMMMINILVLVAFTSSSMNYDVLIVTAFSGLILDLVILFTTLSTASTQKC